MCHLALLQPVVGLGVFFVLPLPGDHAVISQVRGNTLVVSPLVKPAAV